MKIALVVWKLFPSFLGGTERHARGLATSLAGHGAAVDVICADVPARDDPARLPFRVIPVGWHAELPTLLAERVFSEQAARRIERGSYDIAYGHNLALWRYVTRKTIPCVTNPHGLEALKVRGMWPRARGWVRRAALRDTVRHSDAVVSLGGRLTGEIEQFLDIDPARVLELPAAVDLATLDVHRDHTVTKLAGAFLCVARLVANKGVAVLLDAFRRLEGQSPARLYVVGEGPLQRSLEQQLPSNVTMLGSLPDRELAHWYQRAEAFVLPSLFEGMPIAVLEAMGFGLPVIATDIGAVSTMVDAANGWLVPAGDTGALAQAIASCAALDSAGRQRLGEQSRVRVTSRFTWDRIGPATLQGLERVVAASRRGHPDSTPRDGRLRVVNTGRVR